tara:strand:+ start:540 stop:791 length:252 start_codon:yes stop_codon:yes gene_type:complete
MSLSTVVVSCFVLAIVLWTGTRIYDRIQTRRGIIPESSETTLDDIRRLRDEGRTAVAIRRFMELPENRNLYTEEGAKRKVEEL